MKKRIITNPLNVKFEPFDNYGKPIGDPDTCQPPWINELGTLIIFPSIAAWGYSLIVSGALRRVELNFRGPSLK